MKIHRWISNWIDGSGYIEGCRLGRHLPLTLVFFLFLLLPLVDQFAHLSRYWPVNENRKLAPKPNFRPAAFWGYPRGYERYHADHFGMRSLFIHGFSAFRLNFLKASSTRTVLIGKKGWLYLAQEEEGRNCMDYFRGVDPFTSKEMAHWTRIYRQRWEWLRERGIGYLIAFAPDKTTIYPEFLPTRIRRFRGESRLDQIIAYMQDQADLPVLDLRPALLAAKQKRLVFFRTDSHWNHWGAYSAYAAIMNRLADDFPGLAPTPLSRITFKTQSHSGDLAGMLISAATLWETYTYVLSDFPALPEIQLPSAAPGTEWSATEQDAPQKPRLVMLIDSYGDFLKRWFAPHFQRVMFVLDRRRVFPVSLLLGEKPDLVIEEISERFLLGFSPENPGEIGRR